MIALGPSPGGDPDDSDARITWLQNVIPIVATSTNQLRALDEPAEAQADIDRLLDTMVKVTDSAQTMVNAYQAFDIETTNVARLELQGAIDDMQRQMAELGLKRCLTFSWKPGVVRVVPAHAHPQRLSGRRPRAAPSRQPPSQLG